MICGFEDFSNFEIEKKYIVTIIDKPLFNTHVIKKLFINQYYVKIDGDNTIYRLRKEQSTDFNEPYVAFVLTIKGEPTYDNGFLVRNEVNKNISENEFNDILTNNHLQMETAIHKLRILLPSRANIDVFNVSNKSAKLFFEKEFLASADDSDYWMTNYPYLSFDKDITLDSKYQNQNIASMSEHEQHALLK